MTEPHPTVGPPFHPPSQPGERESSPGCHLVPLTDGFGRIARSLRVSVTDRCNLRCSYCMAETPTAPREQLATLEELAGLVECFVKLGIRKVKLTGGEPLLRKGLPQLVSHLRAMEGLDDLSLTTNGLLLAKHASALAQAGLERVNVSLDSLDPDTFFKLTRGHDLQRVLQGLQAAREAGFTTIKLNVVAIRGITEQELLSFGRLARSRSLQVRFIEFMPLDEEHTWQRELVLPASEIHAILHRTWPLEPVAGPPSQPSRDYRFVDGKGSIGLISSVSHPFCHRCDRIRLTADGKLRNCLFSLTETDLLTPLREGASFHELVALIRAEIGSKKAGHGIDGPGYVRPSRPMSSIGG